MAGREARGVRTVADLTRAVRSLARHFKTDTVVVVGSQAVLLTWPDAPAPMRLSPEIDAYPANYRQWEAANPGSEASEEVNALFGYGSHFHEEFGFFIDGVDESTARLPQGWRERCRVLEIEDRGVTIKAIAPRMEDLIVAKLHGLREKDRAYIHACHQAYSLDVGQLKALMRQCAADPVIEAEALAFLDGLSRP